MIKDYVWKRFQLSLSKYALVMLLWLFQTTNNSVINYLPIKRPNITEDIR